ncbi:extracellular solute-binding protein, partial [Patescibacteria group bacterium]|nr:extracellular solute-binding protein [Patescibacteria group bacterium]
MKRITRSWVVLVVTILLSSTVFLVPFSAIAKKITITFAAWEHDTVVEAIDEVMNRLLKENPNIQFKYLRVPSDYDTKVSTMIAGGTPPDLLFVHWMKTVMWAEKGAIVPLDDFLAKEKIFDMDDLLPAVVETYTYKGNLMAVPDLAFPWFLFYNKDEFDKVGLAYPDASWTWRGQFLEAAKKLTRDLDGDGKTDIFGHTQGVTFNRMHNFVLADGGNYFSPDGEKSIIDQPEAYEAIQFVADLMYKYQLMPTPDQMLGQHS